MAGIVKRASGIYSVRVMVGNDRRTISLGTRSESRAIRAKGHIEDLAVARATGELPEKETKRWLAKQSTKLRKRLVALGLADANAGDESPAVTLGPFVSEYIDRYGPAKKPSTVTTWRQCERLLLEFFPAEKPLEAFTPGDAEDFRNYLLTAIGQALWWAEGQATSRSDRPATVRLRKGFLFLCKV